MALQNKKTVMAIVKESTESTPVVPSSASLDYIALQDGFSVESSFSELDNTELTGSIGMAKKTLGTEEPSSSVSHYLKTNGEGIEPNFGILFESLLGGVDVEATEYNTVAGSSAGNATTAGIVKVDTGEGAAFRVGQALHVKSLGEIRCVDSIVGDDLTLNFNLVGNPAAAGINLGKCVGYYPTEEGHPSLTQWVYRANGGAVEMITGSKVTSASIEASAGEFVNCNFELSGVGYYFNPIEIKATTNALDFEDSVGVKSITIPVKFYKDPHDAGAALQTALNNASVDVFTVLFSDITGKYSVSSNGTTLNIDFATTVNSLGAAFGFTADKTGSLSYLSDVELSYAAPHSSIVFNNNDPLVAKNNQVLVGDFDDNACFAARTLTVNIEGTKSNLQSICAESGISGSLITERTVSVELSARLEKHDADKFKRFRQGLNTKFQYTFGSKAGGFWEAGKSGCIYIPTATITSFALNDNDGIIEVDMTLTAYVKDGKPEVFINML